MPTHSASLTTPFGQGPLKVNSVKHLVLRTEGDMFYQECDTSLTAAAENLMPE